MFRIYIFIFFAFITNFYTLNLFAEKNKIKTESFSIDNLIWEYANPFTEKKLYWHEADEENNLEIQIKGKNSNKNNNGFFVRSIGNGVSVNGYYYPEISNYVPNAFVEDHNKVFGLSSRVISKTRFCDGKNFSKSCVDGVLDLDFKLFNNDNFSIYPNINLQSITSRGTGFGEGLSLGVKIAKELSPNWSISLGGENIVHFDESIDLGRNFFVVGSTYFPLNSKEKAPILFFNAGIGSDFYGYKGNGFLLRTTCLGGNTLTGNPDNPNSCTWGPIASAALALNDRFSIINEWFGYSYGTGFSVRPFNDSSLTISLYATDFIKGLPKYAEEFCTNGDCYSRFYGSISLTF